MQELDRFKLYLAELRGSKALKPVTRNARLQALKRLMKEVPDLEVEALRLLFAKLRDTHKPEYTNYLIVSLHHYGRFLETDKYNVFKLDQVEVGDKTTLTDSEIEDFLSLPSSVKWKLYFTILAYTGMRPGEAASLTTSQIDLGRNIFLVTGKSGFRPVPIPPSALHDITDYLKTLDGDYLFPGNRKCPVGRTSWKNEFDRRIKLLGIKRKGLSCHSLRHSLITRLLSEDVNLFKVKKLVGHKRTDTTERYTHLITKDLTKAMAKDPLTRGNLPLYDRMKMFRESVLKLLEEYAVSPEEETQLLKALVG